MTGDVIWAKTVDDNKFDLFLILG